jgi:Ras-related protein Rab-24
LFLPVCRDTAGSERYESMTRHYYKGADGAVICYDLTDAESWEKVKFWIGEIQAVEDNCILTIVGCKLDMIEKNKSKRGVAREIVQQYANTIGAKAFETSALSGQGVAQPFTDIAQQFSTKPKKQPQGDQVLNVNDSAQQKKEGCC